jgi:hypothetical protein
MVESGCLFWCLVSYQKPCHIKQYWFYYLSNTLPKNAIEVSMYREFKKCTSCGHTQPLIHWTQRGAFPKGKVSAACNWLLVSIWYWGIRTGGAVTPFLGALAKLRKATISFVMFVWPHSTTRFPLDGFWWNFMFETFSKIRWENSNFIKIRQK